MAGFFSPAAFSSSHPSSTIPRCGSCGLLDKCSTPKVALAGEGERKVLFVSGFPSREVDDSGRGFSDASGRIVQDAVESAGYSWRDCWGTYSAICYPFDGNRRGTKSVAFDRVDYCYPNLEKTIKQTRPRVIVLLGNEAVRSVLGSTFRESPGSIEKWLGWRIPLIAWNAWLCPTYDPREILENSSDRESSVRSLWFNRHIENAMSLSGSHPYEFGNLPDYEKKVRILYDPDEIVSQIEGITDISKVVSFDYETNCLKPDRGDAEIVSCAFAYQANGRTFAVAFPMLPQLTAVWSKFLRSDTPKVGANTKFEERWSRKVLKTEVRRWVWDTMLSAHHLDNRAGITSVKFQSFVRLGIAPWDGPVKSYLEAPDSVSLNSIRKCDLRTLLLYNGLDAVCELEVAQAQKREMQIQNC